MSTDIVEQTSGQVRVDTGRTRLSVAEVIQQMADVQLLMKEAMKEDTHYGVIPGCGKKPTLLKAGAEKLCSMFRLAPQYKATETKDGDHLECVVTCDLIHTSTGRVVGSGIGSCSSKEAKYAYRKGERTCPDCGEATIIKGKRDYGGGWLCWQKKGGCGMKWADGAGEIESQDTDRVANPELPDTHNTVRKMAQKRGLVASVLVATAASDIFTQDLEDMERKAAAHRPPPPPEPPPTLKEVEVVSDTPEPPAAPKSTHQKVMETLYDKPGVDPEPPKGSLKAEAGLPPGITDPQLKKLQIAFKEASVDTKARKDFLKRKYNVSSAKYLTKHQATKIIDGMSKPNAGSRLYQWLEEQEAIEKEAKYKAQGDELMAQAQANHEKAKEGIPDDEIPF